MISRLTLMGIIALAALVSSAGQAGAVTDQNMTDLGQMPPYADTLAPIVHNNALQQDNFAVSGTPIDMTVTAFAEDIAKTLPLIPGAALPLPPTQLPNGNLIANSGRGIGFSHTTVHNPFTGAIVWQTPRYLGPTDYLLQRTIGPREWISSNVVDEEGNVYNDDGYNAWSWTQDGDLRWVSSHNDLPPGWQRINQEPFRAQSMRDDYIFSGTFAPTAVRAPSGNPLWGGVYTRGNAVWWDAGTGDVVLLKSMRLDGQPAEGIELPLLFALIDLLCFPGGQIALEIRDDCTSVITTRYLSVNTTAIDPIRNRFTFTFGGDGETFDYMKTWTWVTENGEGGPGTVLVGDTDGDGFGDEGLEQVWEVEYGLNSGATPTILPSGFAISGADGNGIAYIFDADTGDIVTSGSGAGAGFSTAADFDDQQAACNAGLGILKISSADASVIWNQPFTGLGLEHLPVVPDAPLTATGRPGQACAGGTLVHRDVLAGQLVLGYPFFLFEALVGLGAPITTGTLLPHAVADSRAGYTTGARDNVKFRSVYEGSGESGIEPTGSGPTTSTSVDAIAAISAGIFNLILPRRFDVSPPTAGFKISEPTSYREALKAQFVNASLFCEDVLAALPSPCTDASCTRNEERLLQLVVNKVRRMNAIFASRFGTTAMLTQARARVPAEVGDLEAAFIVGNIADIVIGVTLAREALLSNQPGNPNLATQNAAKTALEASCGLIDETIDILEREVCTADSQCDDGNACTVNTCNVIGVCDTAAAGEGTACDGDGTCDGEGNCVPPVPGVCDGVVCPVDPDSCVAASTCVDEGGVAVCVSVPKPANADCLLGVHPGTCAGDCGPTGNAENCTCGAICEGGICDDQNPCTRPVCLEGEPACGEPINEPDGTFCGEGLECQAGECVATEPCDDDADCVSNDPCLTRSCNQATNSCNPPVPGNDGGACDADGVPGTCSGGDCVGLCEGVNCPDTECSIGACDPSDGSCTGTPTNEGGDCDLGGGETGVCAGGDCVSANPCAGVDCDDGISCTDNDCDENTGLCINDPLPDGTACDDFPNGYCTPGLNCVSGVKLEQNSLQCLGGLVGFPFTVINSVDTAPVSGGSVVLTSEIIAVNVPTADVLEDGLVDGAVLIAADFELTVDNGTPAGGNPIALSDPNIPRPVGAILEVEANAVTDVSVDGAPGDLLGVTPTQAFLQFRALGGILTVTLGVGVDQCEITGGSALFPIIGN